MPAEILQFPTPEARFHRAMDRLETLAARFPFVRDDASAIATELGKFVVAIDRNLDEAFEVLQTTRASEVRAKAWSDAVREVLPHDVQHQVQAAFQRRIASAR